MDLITLGVLLEIIGWALWAVMARTVKIATAPGWIVADYYISTALLGCATLCTAASALFGAGAALRWLAIVVGIGAVLAVVAMALRPAPRQASASAAGRRGAMAAEAPLPDVSGYTVRHAPTGAPRAARQPVRGGYASVSPRVQAIEAMEVAL